MDVLAEEMEEDVGVDLLVGVVCKKYEEPESCGSAGDFLLGEEIEGEQPGREEVVGDALMAAETDFSFNFNGSNKCQLTSLIDVAPVNDDQVNDSVAPAANFEATAPVDDNQVEYDLGVNLHLPVERKKMPKRKH